MNEPVSAAVQIEGPTVRCVEVVRGGSVLDLARFGERTFEFDVSRALWEQEGETDALERVREAVEQELADTRAEEIRFVLHPLDVFSFFTPVSPDLSERERMRRVVQQAAVLSGCRSADALRITPRRIRDATVPQGDEIEWIHVLALPKPVQERLESLISPLSVAESIRVVSLEAVAELIPETGTGVPASTASYSLGVGTYSTHTEYLLTHRGGWHHGHATADVRPKNRTYYAVGFLNRIGVSVKDVGRLFVYGSKVDQEVDGRLNEIFGSPPKRLTPFDALDAQFDAEQRDELRPYVPCIGALLASADR